MLPKSRRDQKIKTKRDETRREVNGKKNESEKEWNEMNKRVCVDIDWWMIGRERERGNMGVSGKEGGWWRWEKKRVNVNNGKDRKMENGKRKMMKNILLYD